MNTTKKHPFDILKEKGLFVPLIVAVAALLVGLLVGINVNGSSTKTVAAKATPAPTVTVTAEPIAAEPTNVVPQECLDALDNADEGFSIAGDMLGKYSDGLSQITSNELTEAYATIRDINKLNEQLDSVSPDYVSNKELCRAYGSASSS